MRPPPLRSTDLKLSRAKKHIDALDLEITNFLAAKKHIVTEQINVKTGEPTYRIPEEKLSDDWSLLIGDAVSNLRASLDHIMWECVRSVGVYAPDKRIEFPIFKEKGAFLNPAKGGGLYKIVELTYRPHREIVEDVQPYQRWERSKGDPTTDPLWSLYELRNIDTHRKVHTTALGVESPKESSTVVVTTSEGHLELRLRNPDKKYSPIRLLPVPPGIGHYVESKSEQSLPTKVLIDEPDSPPIDRKEVIPLLRGIYDHVAVIADRFRAHLE